MYPTVNAAEINKHNYEVADWCKDKQMFDEIWDVCRFFSSAVNLYRFQQAKSLVGWYNQ